MQDELLQRGELAVFGDAFGLVEALQRAQQIADGVAQLAIGIDRGLQDLLTDALVFGIVDHRHPQTQDVGTGFLDDSRGVNGVALGLRHLLTLLVEGEAVGQDSVERGATARAATFQQRGLEPATVLVRPFEVQVSRPVRRTVARIAAFGCARIDGEGVGRAGIEPDIEDVGDLLVLGRIVVAEKLFVRRGEPHVRAAFGDSGDDAGIDFRIVQRLAGRLVDIHGQRRAPCALTADQPVRAALDHRTDAVLAAGRMEGGVVDGGQGAVTQGVTVRQLLVHADEPLGRVAEDDRGLGTPRVRVGVLDAATRQQIARLDQLFHHRAVGGAELAGLLAFGFQNLQACKQRDVRIIGTVRIDRVRHIAVAVGQPDSIVVRAVAGGRVDKAGTGIVGHVVARQQRYGIAIARVQLGQRVGAFQTRRVDVVDAGEGSHLGRLQNVTGQLVGDDEAVACLGPRLELETFFHGRDFVQAVLDLGAIGDGAVGRDGPRGGGPDHH